jgi:hypothetical protein
VTTNSTFTVIAPILPKQKEELRALLLTMNRQDIPGFADPSNRLVPFGKFANLHFARFIILDDETLDDLKPYGPKAEFANAPVYLAFLGDCDGEGDALLAEFANVAGEGLREIFKHCEGFNPQGDLLQWMRNHSVRPAATYVNCIGRTVTQIHDEAALHEALNKYLKGLSIDSPPQQLHSELALAVQEKGPPLTPCGCNVRRLLLLIGTALAVCILLVPLLVLAIGAALLVKGVARVIFATIAGVSAIAFALLTPAIGPVLLADRAVRKTGLWLAADGRRRWYHLAGLLAALAFLLVLLAPAVAAVLLVSGAVIFVIGKALIAFALMLPLPAAAAGVGLLTYGAAKENGPRLIPGACDLRRPLFFLAAAVALVLVLLPFFTLSLRAALLVYGAALFIIAAALTAFIIRLRYHEITDPEILTPVTTAHLQALGCIEDYDITNQYSVMGSFKPGSFARWTTTVLWWALNVLSPVLYPSGNIARIRTIHSARWVFLDGKRRGLFASNYDGSDEAYMDDFVNKVAFGLNIAFGQGAPYPRTHFLLCGGANREEEFKNTQTRHSLPTEVWYKAYPGLSLYDIGRNTRIRQGLERKSMSDTEIRQWLAEI